MKIDFEPERRRELLTVLLLIFVICAVLAGATILLGWAWPIRAPGLDAHKS